MRKDRSHPTPLTAGFAAICIASLPTQLWSQASWQYGANTISSGPSINVGIGTTAPVYPLDVRSSVNVVMRFSGGATPTSNNSQLRFAGTKDGELWGLGTDMAAGNGSKDFFFYDLSSGPMMTLKQGTGNVGIGTTSPQYRLAVNGTIGAKEVIVTNTGWADYVFKPDYRPKPLSEVAAYIGEHRHLPGIPTEKEAQEQGVNLGEMQVKLLAKIEELTLHMIAEHRRNNRLEQDNRKLRDRIARLERALASHGGDK